MPETATKAKSNEWFTPAKYIEAAREVMGTIDLDPASCAMANKIVKASKYYTQEDNGLTQAWANNVWCNPPYGRTTGIRSYQSLFIEKLLREYRDGNVLQAILLCTADVDEVWFQPLWQFPICFPDHKVWFYRPGLPDEKHIMGSAFVYLGTNEQKFIQVFQQFGTIAKRVNIPQQAIAYQSPLEAA